MATGLGADVTILEVDLERMRFLDITMDNAHTLYSSEAHLHELMATTDLLIGAVLVLSPQTLVDNVSLGVAPTWHDFLIAIPIGMIAYTGIETISNMAEEARDEEKTIPRAINRVVIAVISATAASKGSRIWSETV